MNKLVIANIGVGNRGKSTSIKECFKLLSSRYPKNVTIIHALKSGDVKAIVDVNGTLVGIESQGDPKSRMPDSLISFRKAGCEIILIACRTYGETYDAIMDMKKYGYQIVWTANDKNWEDDRIVDYLNSKYAEHILQLIEDRIAGFY